MPNVTIHHEQHFLNLQSLLDYVVNSDSILPEASRTSRNKNSTEWTGADNLETALHLATFGWEEGLKKIKLITKQVVPKFAELFPRQDYSDELHYDVAGAYEDPVISSIGIDPLCMVNFKPNYDIIKAGSTLQRLIIEVGASSSITAETMFLRGACILALLESLETFGFRVEVILQCTINKRSGGSSEDADLCIWRTTIKTFDEHSDYDKFAYCLANASFLRRLMFSCMECTSPEIISEFGFSSAGYYSYPHNHPIYIDEARDFYMTRPLKNKDLVTTIQETVDIINSRYKGFIQEVINPKLDGNKDGGKE